ncbi:MAG: hypothetical protein DRN17_01100 [Thermoplasmata archaeon]|nr:MAG: hypothetical protein DRN17_01100 [Thermoplasmata archaeon]
MKMSNKGIIAIVVIAVAVVAGISATAIYMHGGNEVSTESVTASVKIDFGNGTVWSYPNISVEGKNATVYGILIEAAHEGNFSVKYTYYGQYDSILVDSIAGVVNGDGNNYWQYWLNGDYGMVGADKQPIADNDIIEWKFTSFS